MLEQHELPIVVENQAAQEIETFKLAYSLFCDWIPSDLQYVREVMMDATTHIIWFFPLIFAVFLRAKEYAFRKAFLNWFLSLSVAQQQ